MSVDFLVIGAQKAGTTSLWQYLRLHPELDLPPYKDDQFFSHPPAWERGLDWWLDRTFPDGRSQGLRGTAHAHHMMGTPR